MHAITDFRRRVCRARETVHIEVDRDGFTLLELLVVIVILGVLGLTLLPVYASNRSGSRGFVCLNNHRQLVRAWIVYASENNDRLVTTRPVTGQMSWSGANPDNIDKDLLTEEENRLGLSPLAKYSSKADVWKCPADTVAAPNGPRVRSMSFNGALVGASLIVPPFGTHYPIGREYLPVVNYLSQLRKPAEVFASIDEHSDSINDSAFMFNPGRLPPQYSLRDLPAGLHIGAAAISFADGSAEMHRWLVSTTLQPVVMVSKPWGSMLAVPDSADYAWMNDRMPYRER